MHTRTYHTHTGAMLICTHWPHTVARSRTCRHMHTHRGCTGAYPRTCIKHTYTLNTYCHTLTYIYAHKHIQHPYCCNAYACAHTMRHAHAHVDRAYTQGPYRCIFMYVHKTLIHTEYMLSYADMHVCARIHTEPIPVHTHICSKT